MSNNNENNSGKEEDFGLVSWDADFGSRSESNKKASQDFMRLENGSNEVRFLTKPFQYWGHKYKEQEDDPGYGENVKCSIFHGECPLCEAGIKRAAKWYFGVIDRRTNSYKILDASKTVCQDLQKFKDNSKWGDPSRYDIDIVVNKNSGGAQGYYTCIPQPPEPLTQQDIEIKSAINLDDLKKRCTPPTPDRVKARIDGINKKNAERRAKHASKVATKAPAKPRTQPPPPPPQEEEDEYTFDPVN